MGFAAILLALLAFLSAGAPQAAPAGISFLPDYLRAQFAGQSGLLSLGAGYSWWDRRLENELAYGYVPAALAGLGIHVISQKNALTLARFEASPSLQVEPLRIGFAANVSQGKRYEVIQPSHHWDYYWPDGLYLWYFAAARITRTFGGSRVRGASISAEVGTINQYLRAYTSSNSLDPGDILSLALSAQIYL